MLGALGLSAIALAVTSVTVSRTSNSNRKSDRTSASKPTGPDAGQITPPSSTPAGWKVSYPISLPVGYSEPTGIVSDGAGGIFLFANGQVKGTAANTLFHWDDSTQSLLSYAIDEPSGTLAPGQWTPLLVDDAGNVFIGIHSTLLEFDPSTRATQSTDLPAVSVGAPGSGLPFLPPPPGSGASTGTDPDATIDSLALSSTGEIVVARQFATELQVVDPSTLTVGTMPLPAATALAGLGEGDLSSSSSKGVLAAALYTASGEHELGQLVQGSWSESDSPCPAFSTSVSENELVVSGPQCVAAGALLTTALWS